MSVQRPGPAPARQRVQAALALAPLDPPTLGALLCLSSTSVYRSLEELAARGLVMPVGHAPRQRRGGLRAVRWKQVSRA